MILPFCPFTSSVCARLLRLEEPWYDETCSRPGSTPFLGELQPTPGGQHCLVLLWWKGGHPYLGSRLTVDPKHAQLGLCLDSELCHMLCGAGHCLGRSQSYVQTPPSPMATFDSSGSGLLLPVHGSLHHDRLTPPPMVDCTPYHDWRTTISIIRLDAGINQPIPLPTAHPDPTVTMV